jgi:transcriptional regulator with XRE-family HTH domain
MGEATVPANTFNTDLAALGLAIRDAREAKGWSGTKLAKFACITAPYINQLEAGKTRGAPSIPYLRAIADALRGGPNDLVERYTLRAELLAFAGHADVAYLDELMAGHLREILNQTEEFGSAARKLQRLAAVDAEAAGWIEGLLDRLLGTTPLTEQTRSAS